VRITVEVHRLDLVEVSYTPNLIEWLFGKRSSSRMAVPLLAIYGGRLWIFDDTSRAVDDATDRAIERAVFDARRELAQRTKRKEVQPRL
jgi:hypothetical protein